MAIVQISQIQIRRGLQQDLPQLASAEMGWSLDTRRLYIGNGTTEEGAPTEGVTEILTQYSNFLSTIPNYTFAGTDSGYTSQTGVSALTSIARTLQSVLDDIVTVRDFGAVGNGTTDDTDALNRAIQQIYVRSLNNDHANVQRTIKIPAGTYLVSGPIIIPPNCTLIGDGKNNTVIKTATGPVFQTGDSLFQTGAYIGNLGGIAPAYIFVSSLKVITEAGTSSVAQIDSAHDVIFDNVYFSGPSSVVNLVSTAGSTATTKAITFNGCVFDGGVNGFAAITTSVGIRITNSTFINNTTNGINVTSYLTGLVSQNNYFDSTVPNAIAGLTGNSYSYGDTVSSGGGIYSGAAKIGTGSAVALTTGLNTITTLAAGAGHIEYQLSSGSAYRYGTLKYTRSSTGAAFDDEYTEPATSLNANLFIANATGVLTCTVTGSTTLKYNIKQFI
jgi:hypothetical protein